jgi:hypothetical protein
MADDADAAKDANAFDVSGTSVASLQFFLDGTAITTIDVAIETLREYCPDCTPHLVSATLIANKWEVAQIHIPGFTNEGYKSAIRIFTAELPFPFYKWTNAPFFSKVRQRRVAVLLLFVLRLTRVLGSVAAHFLFAVTPHTSKCCCAPFKSSCPCRSLLTKAWATVA